MKKLLTTITLSALVGTSASNLKPMFTNNVVNHGFKSNKNLTMINSPFIKDFKDLKDKKIEKVIVAPNGTIYAGSSGNGLWKSTDGAKFNQVSGIPNSYAIQTIDIAPDGTIWVGTNQKLYFSNDNGINFNSVTNNKINNITSIAIAPNGTIYVAVYGDGLWKLRKGETDFEKITSVLSSIIYSIYIDERGNIFLGASLSYQNTGLWKSTDGINFINIYPKNNITSIAIAPNGTIYASINQKLSKSTDSGITFQQVSGISNGYYINSIAIAPDGTIWVGTNQAGQRDSGLLYKSTDGINFKSLGGISEAINCVYLSNGSVYLTDGGLVKCNLIENLFRINKPDYFGYLYNGFVYKNEQKIDIKEKFIVSTKLDGKSITVPTTHLDISVGEHTLILTLKDEYKQYLDLFGGNTSTGQVTYKLWVKTSIDKNKIDYSTKIDDTQLYTGLVSNVGNTNGADIIQTKSKKGTGNHDASINIDFKDTLIDYQNSYFVQGTVDNSNDFIEIGTHQNFSKFLSIQNDGIYHFHLVDTVGNKYDSYLELGENNWKLTGTFNDSELEKLKTKLNVTVNLTDPTQKAKALGWLHQYENFVDKIFEETIKTNGKGFDSEIKNLITSYKAFLKPLTYDIANEPKFDDGLDKSALVTTITDKANELLKNGLDILPKNLNVDTKNVVNKSTLTSYTNWINNYQDFISKNKDKWINDIANIASRGFATKDQENQIKAQVSQFLNNDTIKKYLKNIVWEDNKLLKATSNDYLQYVELDKLQTDTINWVNEKLPDINQKYQKAIQDAESDLNLHGYSIYTLLNGKPQPQTKTEIDNFSDGQSYHDWLQSQANIKFRGWQLAMGFGIAIPLLLVVVAIAWVIRSRTNPKYNPIAKAKKLDKQEKINQKLGNKKNKNE